MDSDSDVELDYESDIEIEVDEILSLDTDSQEVSGASADESQSSPENPAPSTWSDKMSDVYITDFRLSPGPQNSLPPTARPIDYFFLMFPLALINTLVEETNRYAQQSMESSPNSTWYETNIEELRAFLGIQIIFGIKNLPRLRCYWSQDIRYRDPYVSSIMTINRFKNVSRYFHFRDTSQQPQRGDPDFDPLFNPGTVAGRLYRP